MENDTSGPQYILYWIEIARSKVNYLRQMANDDIEHKISLNASDIISSCNDLDKVFNLLKELVEELDKK